MGLVAVAAGTAWAVGGADALGASAMSVVDALPFLAVTVGVLLLGRAVAPRGPVLGPLILIVTGAVWLAFQFDLVPTDLAARVWPLLLIGGGILVAMSERSPEDPLAAIVARRTVTFLPRRWTVHGSAPQKVVLRCLLADAVLDLGKATFPMEEGATVRRVTIDLTVIGGQADIRIPAGWAVRAGRVSLTRRMAFVGDLTSAEPASDRPSEDDEPNLVVLNIQGWLGRIVLTRPT
jgi:Domain of unknown function (DUF5668)